MKPASFGLHDTVCAETWEHRDRNRLSPCATFDKSSSSYYGIEIYES